MTKPKIVISRCFFQPVRYNGGIVIDQFVEKLKPYIEYLDFCPESDIGLGVPRQRLIIVEDGLSKRLIQPETGKDFTEQMIDYANTTVSSIDEIDGFILKAKSPSCGVGSTKLYRDGSIAGKTDGFFAEAIKKSFPHLPVEDEGRLRDEGIRKHFLTRVFAFSELRQLCIDPKPKYLVDFHSKYKFLIMSYSQKHLQELGQIVADGKMSIEDKIDKYKEKFYQAFAKKTNRKRNVNVFMHILGYVSKNLNEREKKHILQLIDRYSKGNIEMKVITELFKSLAYRFENEYIVLQKFLEPYPPELES